MANATPLQQNMSSAGNIAAFLEMLRGKPGTPESTVTTSGGGSTTQRVLDKEVLDGILARGLQGTQGLAAVSSGQKTAGLYNSSTNQLLTNDLLARLTAETASMSAPTVVTKQPETRTVSATPRTSGVAGNSLLPLAALGIGAGMLAGEDGRKKIAEGDISGFGQSIMNNVGFGGSSVAAGGVDLGALAMENLMIGGGPGTAGGIEAVAAFGDSLNYSAGAAGFGGAASATGTAPSFLDTTLFGETTVGQALPYLPAVGNLLQGDISGAAGAGLGTYLGSMTPLGPIGGAIGGFIGDALFGDDGCFITTAAVVAIGKEDNCFELQTLREFRDTWMAENHPEQIKQYYEEAPEIVAHIQARADAIQILTHFWDSYILPAVEEICAENFEAAHEIYCNLFQAAQRLAAAKE